MLGRRGLAKGEQLLSMLAEQVEVLAGVASGVLQVGGGLLKRQGQIPQRLSQRRGRLASHVGAPLEEGNRLAAGGTSMGMVRARPVQVG